jgi:hypothetical protein
VSECEEVEAEKIGSESASEWLRRQCFFTVLSESPYRAM